MPKIVYIEPSGNEVVVDLTEGWTLMQGAINNGVAGMEAECSGSCACASCHCYIESHAELLPPPSQTEIGMLAHVAAERRANSRLACQIRATAEMDGMVVRLPPSQ